jgi:hypothetical protein
LGALQAAAYGEDSDIFLFTGEMVFPWMFEDLACLRPMKGVAEVLAQSTAWSKLYDSQQLQRNEVPIASATYVEVCYCAQDYDRLSAAVSRAAIRQLVPCGQMMHGVATDDQHHAQRIQLADVRRGCRTCMLISR